MEQLVQFFHDFGVAGLFLLSFIESFISPILPDVLLIPMALSRPDQAIYYSVVATSASVLGGFVGYFLGNKYGFPIVRRYVPNHHVERIQGWITNYGGWAIFLAALAPIPFKLVSISAGVFRVNLAVFCIAAVAGRAKRFLLEGILIFYYGPVALDLVSSYTDEAFLLAGLAIVAAIAGKLLLDRRKKARQEAQKPDATASPDN